MTLCTGAVDEKKPLVTSCATLVTNYGEIRKRSDLC